MGFLIGLYYDFIFQMVESWSTLLIFSKCQKYTPNESNKTYEKAVTKKCGISFDPNLVVDALRNDTLNKTQMKTKEEYLKTYLEVWVWISWLKFVHSWKPGCQQKYSSG